MRSKLRHPIRAIREPFGTAGLIVACVALIAALGGSALAAKGALTAKQKKEVTKIAKKYAGKPGAPGATGPQGPQGNPGAAGANGKDGANGTPGTNGKSVVVNTEAPGDNCGNGGVNVALEGSTTKRYVCNGGFSEEMASGTTLRGQWSVGQTPPGTSFPTTSISYLMKYPGDTPPTVVFVRTPGFDCSTLNGSYKTSCEGEQQAAAAHCHGSVEDPTADAGFVCFYEANGNPDFEVKHFPLTSTLYGVTLVITPEAPSSVPNPVFVYGTWAVTAA